MEAPAKAHDNRSLNLNPHAPEFRPSNNSHHSCTPYIYQAHYHPNYFLSPPPVLLPDEQLQPKYPYYPQNAPLASFSHPELLHHQFHQQHYYSTPVNPNDNTTPSNLPPLLPSPIADLTRPIFPETSSARPKQKPADDHHVLSRSKTISNTRRRSLGSAGGVCNYREKRGLKGSEKNGIGDDHHHRQGQGHNGHFDGARVCSCGCRKKWGGERTIKELIMPVKPGGEETTVMIRNIPNQYTLRMLMKFLDEFCNEENQKSITNGLNSAEDAADDPYVAYDFLYLPIDFKTGANKGYAFVNFTQPVAVQKLHSACGNKSWKHCFSHKICQTACASIQGKEKLKEHFSRSRFICNDDDYLPMCFSPPRDGSGSTVTETRIGECVKSFSRSTK